MHVKRGVHVTSSNFSFECMHSSIEGRSRACALVVASREGVGDITFEIARKLLQESWPHCHPWPFLVAVVGLMAEIPLHYWWQYCPGRITWYDV